MPRMSEAEKQKSHRRILDAASHLIRDHGIEATSVSEVMKAAGLTHGGFYRHFDSKEDLIAAAFGAALEEVLADVEAAPAGPEHNAAREQYLSRYLSKAHVADRAKGCPLAALATEIARLDGPVRPQASQAVERMAGLLGNDDTNAVDRGLATMALLIGTITLARLAETPELAAKILEAGNQGRRLLEQHW